MAKKKDKVKQDRPLYFRVMKKMMKTKILLRHRKVMKFPKKTALPMLTE